MKRLLPLLLYVLLFLWSYVGTVIIYNLWKVIGEGVVGLAIVFGVGAVISLIAITIHLGDER